jgi:hypothetical protein
MNHAEFERLSPVFLLGIARSGTTLLQSLLDGHPQLLVDVADSHFYRWYKRYYRWLDRLQHWYDSREKRVQYAEAVMIDYIFNEPSHYYRDFLSHISISELKVQFLSFLDTSQGHPKDYLESYFHALGIAAGHLSARTRYWVDKTLSYEYLFYRYAQWWPTARFIYMVRDPRDIYTSYKKRDLKNNRPVTSIESFALMWGNSVRTLLDCQRMIAPEKCYILRYEDLVYDPGQRMQSIAQFLDIEMLPGLLKPTKGFGRVPWGGNPESGKKQTGVIYQEAAHKWARSLEAQEIAKMESLLQREMEAVGYSLSTPSQNLPLAETRVWLRRSLFRVANLGL